MIKEAACKQPLFYAEKYILQVYIAFTKHFV